MTKLSSILGEKYQAKRTNIFTRSFVLGEHTFKVRIPFVAEADEIYKKINSPDDEHVEKIYKALTEPLLKLQDKEESNSDIVYTENDILVQGRSMREAANNKASIENRVTEYIKLLVPENAEMTLADLTYEEVSAEFPWTVQLALVEKIAEAISPSYKEARGN